MTNELTPSQIVDALDRYIIGQNDAKKNVAIALRNRWRRRHAPEDMRDEIMPNNIIMIGPTGVGKTEIARRLAKLSGAPFIKVEASKFTEVGYVGRDVDSMIRDLTDIAINIVREEHEEEVQERAHELAEERILDALLPSSPQTKPSKKSSSSVSGPGFVISSDVNGDEAEEESTPASRTRERFRTMLHDGDLDDREIEIQVSGSDQSSMLQVFGPMGMEEMGMNLQELFGNLGGGNKKKRRVKVENAWEPLQQEEAQKLIDMDKVKSEALDRVQQSGIVFIDEIDKVTVRSSSRGGNGGGQDVSREGVQRDLLPVVEGANVTTKHGMVKTDHILFIASGAFHVAKPSDLIPELQGRFPIRVELNNLDADDFFRILTEPRNALIKQYRALMQSEGVEIEFTEDAIREVARTAAEVNAEVENIGARRLHTILTTLLEDILFDIPDTVESDHVVIDKAMVEDKLADIVADRDLSQYIL
ncbi:MAG: ATP-dependent protease ATPase subunit HslU [Bacteroidetes bacterium]|jgi:ATP-dependent HslUV protease ATP-binding subunit HslU|nr:ATP-dependent protease ATPase subunit HslU [Bacteroidota bacterium]